MIAIPKALRWEQGPAQLQLHIKDLEALDQAFRAPQRKQRLAMV